MNVPDRIEHEVFITSVITLGPQISFVICLESVIVIDPHKSDNEKCKFDVCQSPKDIAIPSCLPQKVFSNDDFDREHKINK